MPGRGTVGIPEGQGLGLHQLGAPRTWPGLGTELMLSVQGSACGTMGGRPCGGAGQGPALDCGCVCSWMGTCRLTAAWKTTCWCCPPSDLRTQAPMSAQPLTARARLKPLPTCRCQVKRHLPHSRLSSRPAHCLGVCGSSRVLCPQSGWCPTSRRPPTPSCRCPPSKTPTGNSRSRSPSGPTQLMVSQREAAVG